MAGTPRRHSFTDPVSGQECVLVLDPDWPWFDRGVGVEHPGCEQHATVHPELDAFWCTACQWNGRISGAWAIDMREAVSPCPECGYDGPHVVIQTQPLLIECGSCYAEFEVSCD